MLTKSIKEIRVWEENGKVHTREIINESIDDVNMTPHPTECKLIFIGNDIKTIYSQEIEETDEMSSDLVEKLILTEMKYIYDLDHDNI